MGQRDAASDVDGNAWRSSARFRADEHGVVPLSSPSIGGSYIGSDAMGLFELMKPVHGARRAFLAAKGDYVVTLRATLGKSLVATATATRLSPLVHGVSQRGLTLARDGIDADLFEPRGTTRMPGMLLIGGSEGGKASTDLAGELLAGDGYPAMALAYFHEPGLPSTLHDIPLEYFGKALAVLARQPGVDPTRLVVWGVSRGSEAALLTGAHYPKLVHAVIAGSPSSTVNGGYPGGGVAWTWHGQPLPPLDIPVERIRGPAVTICGDDDSVWASCTASRSIAARRAGHHTAYRDLDLQYPHAGHGVGSALCYFSTTATEAPTVTGQVLSFGGTVEANAAAAADTRTRVLAFLAALR